MKRNFSLWFDPPQVLAAQMELIDHSFGIAMLGCFLASLLMSVSIMIPSGNPGILIWTSAMGLICGAGHFGRRYLPERTKETQAKTYARCMLILLICLGGLWGFAGWLYMDLHFPPTAISVLALIAGMSAGALSIFSPCLPLAAGFFLPAILPVWSVFILTRDTHYLPMFLGVPLYLLVLLVFAHNYSRVTRRSIALRFENTGLVSQLREQTSRAEIAQHAAEDANRAKSVFLASASHDLRQPLHALGLFIVSLSRTPLNTKQAELVKHIDASANAAREMLNTLLDFSKLEAGVVKPQAKAFRLQPLLHKLENEFAPLAESKNLVYRTHDTLTSVYADPALTELILRNFIANAIRYTETGGMLTGVRLRNGHAVLEVWDTGIGIPPDQQKEIFREFHQLGNPERDRRKGLGLGLAIAKGLAETMGTRISVSSRPARGSVFRLALPLADIRNIETSEPLLSCVELVDLKGQNVLIIEDDHSVQTAMTELLHSWGCLCRAVESEQEALITLATFSPTFIIADFRLRGNRTGQEALTVVYEALGKKIPALIVTGDTAPDRLRNAEASEIPLLHKPVRSDLLYSTMVTLIRQAK